MERPETSSQRNAENYVIAARHVSPMSVEVWSSNRLPFEPKGEMIGLRDAIRRAIDGLDPADGHALYGCYTSLDRSLCDAENVLFYNVRDSGFPKLCAFGLTFERAFKTPPPSARPDLDALHHHYYEMRRPAHGFRAWTEGKSIVSWRDVAIEPIDAKMGPARAWRAMKTASFATISSETLTTAYGLRVIVSVPRGAAFSVSSRVKPLLDGVISAFHTHDGSDLEELSSRLAATLGASQDEVARLLMSEAGTALGTRRLLWRFRAGVQWNPADDGCVAAQVLVEESGAGWRLSGELFEVTARRD